MKLSQIEVRNFIFVGNVHFFTPLPQAHIDMLKSEQIFKLVKIGMSYGPFSTLPKAYNDMLKSRFPI